MPIATTAEQQAAAASVRAWAQRANTVAVVRSQENDPTAWRSTWDGLTQLGVFAMALPDSHGGLGGSVADLATVLEQATDSLVPGPILGNAITGLLLARVPGSEDLAARVAEGLAVGVAIARVPGTGSDDGLILSGPPVSVVCGEGADALLVLVSASDHDVYVLIDTDAAGVKIEGKAGADLTRPLAEVSLDGVVVPAERVLHGVDTDLSTDVAITLAAAEAAGVASWALRTATDYAKVREQFGKRIGSFQAIKHLCAEMLCRSELATAAAWDAALALNDDDQRPIAAAVAGAICLDAAVENAKDCIQVLGGIGFTWEHDAHFYLRRAVSSRQLSGGSAFWRGRVADLTRAGARRVLDVDLGEHEQQRAEVRARAEAIAGLDDQRVALADAGYLAPHWPAPHGLGAGAAEQLLIAQELERAGVHRPDLVIAGWAIPTILQYGSAEQIERFVAPTLRGEMIWCQLFSEPGAGSDLAALRTKAERVDGGWRLTGQKVWTSVAHRADWGICLARTNPDAPKHKGITYFLVDMKSAGIDVRPLREITGEALFNEVFLDELFVPDECVVGEVDNGWTLARATLANERVAMGGKSSIGEDVEHLVALAEKNGLGDDALVRDRLGEIVAQGVAASLLDVRATLRQLDGRDPGPESSVRKLVGVRHRQHVAESALELLGSAEQSKELWEFLQTRCLTIAGGTSQVLLTLAAERLLGLPRG